MPKQTKSFNTKLEQIEIPDYSNETEKYLPENTPILMSWLVKDPIMLKLDQLPLPDNERFPYKQRLLNWADNEPQRKIKLYYVSTGLTEQQVQKMRDLMDVNKGGRSNIEVIDFNSRFKDKYDLKFLNHEKVCFAWKIDIMRLVMLAEDGPAIYFDFDILPIEGKKIGKIEMNNVGYKLASKTGSNLENSIIAVDFKGKHMAAALCNTIKSLVDDDKFLDENGDNSTEIWGYTCRVANHAYSKMLEINDIDGSLSEKKELLLDYLQSNKLKQRLKEERFPTITKYLTVDLFQLDRELKKWYGKLDKIPNRDQLMNELEKHFYNREIR